MLRLCLQRAGQASASAAASCSPSVPALSSVARMLPAATCRPFSSEPEKEEREITNPVVLELVDRIVQLNLMEVSDLTELLRKRLNLPAAVGMPMMAAAAPAAAAAPGARQDGVRVEGLREDIGGGGTHAGSAAWARDDVGSSTTFRRWRGKGQPPRWPPPDGAGHGAGARALACQPSAAASADRGPLSRPFGPTSPATFRPRLCRSCRRGAQGGEDLVRPQAGRLRRRGQDQGHQGDPGRHRPRPQGGQGAGTWHACFSISIYNRYFLVFWFWGARLRF